MAVLVNCGQTVGVLRLNTRPELDSASIVDIFDEVFQN